MEIIARMVARIGTSPIAFKLTSPGDPAPGNMMVV